MTQCCLAKVQELTEECVFLYNEQNVVMYCVLSDVFDVVLH